MSRSSHSKVSFSKQLSTAFVTGIFFLAVISSLVISWVVSTTERDKFIEQGIQLTRQFSAQSKLALLFGSGENAELPAKTLIAFPDVLHVAIYNLDNSALLTIGSPPDKINQLWFDNAIEVPLLTSESSQAWYFVSKVVRSPDPDLINSPFSEIEPSTIVLGYVMVTLGKGSLHGLMQGIFVVNTLIALALASILMLILRLITRRLTTPLERFSEIMLRAEKGEIGIRAELHGPKELVVMEQAFNKMMSLLEERQTELQVARDRALETARVKAEFAAVVSHEIRTPLNGVLGMLNLLKEVGVPEKQKQYLDVAIQSGDDLLHLINDILDFSKIDAGMLELEYIDFDLRARLEDVLILFAEEAQRKNITPCLSIPSDLPLTVNGDLTRLRQILSNFLSNAIKFTERGEILLSVSYQKADKKHWLFAFSVKDTGIGIPRDAQKRIFDSFSQADSSTTRKFGGTGLGLTICRQLIDLLGGRLTVDSSPGKGSTFSFSLGLEVIQEYKAEPIFKGRTCLVMDENKHNCDYLVDMLSSFGCLCSTARGEEDLFRKQANREWQHSPFDILLFDPEACQFNVHRFLERIRSQQNPLAKRLVILMSPALFRYADVDVDTTLSLPVRYEKLRQCLERQFSRHVSDKQLFGQSYIPARRPASDIQILVVDDNRTNQLVAKAMLNESGYLVDVAASGRDAVEYVSRKNYDLVLMDCNMPDMDGYEATKRIRSLAGNSASVPVFAMTAADNARDIKKCLDVGMDDYLIKPLALEVLRQKLNKLFQLSISESAVSTEVDQSDPIDADSFSNLEITMGNKIGEIIDVFLTDAPTYIADLQNAVDTEDWVRVADVAHSLKGSSRNLGANHFASVCREIEDFSSKGALTAKLAKELLSDLEMEYRKVELMLTKKLAQLADSKYKRGHGKGEIVLIVDDDRSTRWTIANALELDGLHIEQAANGREAVDKFSVIKPDLVIMDAVMPVMDGFNASLEIKRTLEGRKTPILMITALENDESIERAFRSGAADFIPKPINLAVLRQRVKRVLDARQSEQRVERLAYIDGLTGLPNRIAFSDRLMQDLAYAKRNGNQVAIMFIDIDHFKDVNDNMGHAAGDELLKVLAERISRCVRSEDTLARLGGDEFVVLLSSVNGPKGADIAAHNLLQTLSTSFHIAGKELFIGASIGISMYPEDGTDREALLKNSDTAMYRAKALGRNNYQFYTQEMSASISERVAIETDLRTVKHNDELIVYYQPKADCETGEIVGAEALLRWNHPTRGFLLPGVFIQIADEIGMLDQIGGWVIDTACGQFDEWLKLKRFDAGIAINVSSRQLMSSGFVNNIKLYLELSGLNPEFLEIEIIENTILEHADETIEKLKQLSSLGVRIAIDDFGVGYSSFSYLKQFPVNVLKIDRSFILDLTEDKSGAAIVDGMIKLAHNLNLQVVAEGVEDKAQSDFLREHGCDLVQGYFISKPLPPEQFFNQYVENVVNVN